jgi:MraZ protein
VGRRTNRRFALKIEVEQMFFGQYDHSLDEKGRLTIPARYRDLLEGGAYITRGLDNNLIVMRSIEFDQLYHNLEELSITNPKARRLNRVLFGSAAMLEMDKAGRILIPQFLRDAVHLDSLVKVVGIGHYFELWTPESWNEETKMVEDGDLRAEMFEDLNLTFKNG